MIDRLVMPKPKPLAPDIPRKGQFRTGQKANGNFRIFRRAEAPRASIELPAG
jgi:hypothetical protein